LGVEVVVGQLPGGRQAGETGQAFLAAFGGGGDLDGQQLGQERGVAEVVGGGVVEVCG